MSSYVIPSPPAVTLPVRGSGNTFPVRRVYCVGRNYADHAVEMGHDPTRELPFFFQKNADNLVTNGRPFPYPVMSRNVHHEVECFVALKDGGVDIDIDQALDCVYGYGVAVDFTRRDLQEEAKAKARPWEMAKAFDNSAPVSAIAPAAEIGHPERGAISLFRNGARAQHGDLAQMIWKTPEIIAELSRYVRLAAGDVLLTGTPAGVGPVERTDHIVCTIEGVGELAFEVI